MTATPGRCHFDTDGWLQGPVSITHMLTPNRYSSGFAEHAKGVVFHTEDGYEAGTIATFMSPAAKVSAFFAVGQDGSCTQFLPVGHGYCAWAQVDGNQAWRSIEDADNTHPSVPLTDPQMAAFAQILEACSAYDGFPLRVADDVNGAGLITHSAGGTAWGGHTGCPGPVRAAQRPVLIALAKMIREGSTTVSAASDGTKSLQAIAAAHKTSPAYVLHLTAKASDAWPVPVHDWLDSIFNGKASPTGPVPRGVTFQVPSQ